MKKRKCECIFQLLWFLLYTSWFSHTRAYTYIYELPVCTYALARNPSRRGLCSTCKYEFVADGLFYSQPSAMHYTYIFYNIYTHTLLMSHTQTYIILSTCIHVLPLHCEVIETVVQYIRCEHVLMLCYIFYLIKYNTILYYTIILLCLLKNKVTFQRQNYVFF